MTNVMKARPKLYVMDNGRMSMDKNWLIGMHNPATILNPNAATEFVEFPVYTVLSDHPEGKILFDTACNPNGMGKEGRWPEMMQLAFPWAASEECSHRGWGGAGRRHHPAELRKRPCLGHAGLAYRNAGIGRDHPRFRYHLYGGELRPAGQASGHYV